MLAQSVSPTGGSDASETQKGDTWNNATEQVSSCIDMGQILHRIQYGPLLCLIRSTFWHNDKIDYQHLDVAMFHAENMEMNSIIFK